MSEFEIDIHAEGEKYADLCAMYWETTEEGSFAHTVKVIAEAFGEPVHRISKIVSEMCSARSTSKYCRECGKGFVYRTRSEWTSNSRFASSRCQTCADEQRRRQVRQAEREKAAERAAILACFPVLTDGVVPRVEDLDIRAAFTLAAIFEDAEEIYREVSAPLDDRIDPLTPTHDYDLSLVNRVFEKQLILIHPSSPPDCFEWDGDGALSGRYFPRRAYFYMAGSRELETRVEEYRRNFADLIQSENWPDPWISHLHDFWLELAVSECKAYLVHMLDRHKLSFSPGPKTDDVFRRGLKWYSIGQIYYFIWRAARDSAAYLARERVPKKQAANSAITRIAADIDRAYADGWQVSTYRRDPKLPISTISHILFSRALKFDDPMAYSPVELPARRAGLELDWAGINAATFERLIFQLISDTEGYESVEWLMHTNAPDHGRDVSAVRLRRDPLSGHSSQRVAIQCKHWTSRSVSAVDVNAAVVSLDNWQNPPFDVLVIATSGRFTSDAVAWIERHNSGSRRPSIEVWNDARLEVLLDERPHLIRSFELR